ncbi:putative ABC transport system permease protein [Litorivivens lipolytica]|uniref:Putative ABC transport system permease protein n=1 Tax=Litorivivens lipolytica TaxID=1524264 RepID=A0A7W4W2E5_9GAMM|nr:FtsX-like permease family protein [Litorivivens lipolytica]MBB3046193.1 putative ABC transport system permease protein [Litorivivens lipolytica]
MSHLRWLMREWRGGELALLLVSLLLAVTIVSGVAGFAERLQRGIVGESHQFLAADLVLKTPRALPAEAFAELPDGVETARVIEFRSMVVAGEAMELASIKAVSERYPLKGELTISDEPFGLPLASREIPPAGTAWLDSRLFPLLGIEIGDALQLGDVSLRAEQALITEPDRGTSFYGMGPRVLINEQDVARSGVVQAGSLVDYRYLFAGASEPLAQVQTALQPQLTVSDRWQSLDDSQPQIARTLERAERFLLLAGSFGVALAGVAVALAARRYSQRHLDTVAVMKALGAGSSQITRLYVGNILLLALVSALLGWALGLGVQTALFAMIRDLVGFTPPAGTLRPLLAGAITALLCVASFALPPVLRLRSVPPLRVLRRDLGNESLSSGVSAGAGIAGLFLLMLWYTGSVELVLAVLVGVAVILGLAGILVLRLFTSLRRWAQGAGGVMKLALSAMVRRRQANAFQVVSLALALMVLLCIIAARSSLMKEWQLQLPTDTPNHFLVNIAPDQVAPVDAWLDQHDIRSAGLYPMVRGRLVTIDGQDVYEIPEIEANRGSVNREINLSWSEQLPEDNKLTSGHWWTDSNDAMAQVSVEEEFAERLGISVGTRLGFRIGGLPLEAEVSSLRSLSWDSMRPNFFLLFEPGVLEAYPSSSITSFYLDANDKVLLNDLLSRFPTITLIEMDAVIRQARTVVDQVSAALELVLVLIIACALLVGIANLQASLDSRLHENAILRTLGASRQLIRTCLLAEFALIGLLAGLLAGVGAEICLYLIQTRLLDMEPSWHPMFWLAAPIGAASLVAVSGWWFCREVIVAPPLQVLRRL